MFSFVAAVAAAITMLMILRPSERTSMCARVCKPECPSTNCDTPLCVASIDEALLILDSYVDGQRTFGMVDIANLLQDTMPHELVDAGLHMSQWMICGLLHIMYISDPTTLTARHYAVLLASILAQEDNTKLTPSNGTLPPRLMTCNPWCVKILVVGSPTYILAKCLTGGSKWLWIFRKIQQGYVRHGSNWIVHHITYTYCINI